MELTYKGCNRIIKKHFDETTHDSFFGFGILGLGTLEPQLDWILLPFIEIQYKIAFVGEKYGKTPLNIQNSFSVCVGVKYRIK